MWTVKWGLGNIFVLMFCLGTASPGKVLVWPADNSHWINLKVIIQELSARGHHITVLWPSFFQIKDSDQLTSFHWEEVTVPFPKAEMDDILEKFFHLTMYEQHENSLWEFSSRFYQLLVDLYSRIKILCDTVVRNEEWMKKLQLAGFDLLLTDPLFPCGELVAEKLQIPFVYSFRFSEGNTFERLCGALPAPPSYVPASTSGLTDRMSFLERMQNLLIYSAYDFLFHLTLFRDWNQYYSDVLGTASPGKVLVLPADNSHWINLKVIVQELTARGHNVTVLWPSFFQIKDSEQLPSIHREEVRVPFPKAEMDDILEKFFHLTMYEQHEISSWEFFYKLHQIVVDVLSKFKILCDTVVWNEERMKKLQSAGFDLLLADPLFPCSELVAEKLQIPFLYSFRFSGGNTLERLCGALPAPPSYVPASTSGLTDRMSFLERMQNLLIYSAYDSISYLTFFRDGNQYYSDVLGKPTTLCEMMGKAEMWLIRTYWDFEFPRPLLPNFEFVGGLHCQPAKPLPQEMEAFVQSSGDHGIVVFSLGSMVGNLTDEKSNTIALALSQIPQKVIWRYKGKRPDTLGSNTRLYDWIPQNDLLGHPKTKAFITHGGTNGIYEAIYHGIPMVGIPLFADQTDNIVHMRAKGMAVELNFHTLRAQDLVEATNAVIHNATYKENAVRVSQIHHDQPLKPLDRAVFWIEFVMRHKSAKHLRPAAHHLTWYQYHCLDVLAFLAVCTAVFIVSAVKCCMFCCRKCGRVIKKRKTE